jgi:hypothetical protein
MAYFENTKLKDSTGTIINPTQDDSLTLLRAIFKLLKPLAFITGGGSNRLSVDVNSGTITTVSTVSNISAGTVTANCNINASQTLGTVTTVGTVTNIPTIANITSFDLMKAMSRTGYNSGIRSNIT